MRADRYFGSFPKVGIVIPNAAAWLLPEFQDLANALEHTLDLPTILPHGARIDPTADGFLLWLPTCAFPFKSPVKGALIITPRCI